MNTTVAVPTEEELVQRARTMIPVLRQRADACEKARMVPPETIAEFEAAGFYNIVRQREFGGYEMSPHVFYRILHELGRGCPSSAWVMMVTGIHNWELAIFGEKSSHDLWDTNPSAKTSSSYHPWGTAEPVEGGYRLNGTWKFSSGCDHCSWAILGGFVPADNPTGKDLRVFLVPRTDYQISDTWFTFGLQGTGSKDVVLKDVFVPSHRTHSLGDCFTMAGQAKLPPTFRTSFGNTFSFAVSSVLIGIAQGAIDIFIEQMGSRKNTLDGSKSNLSPYVRDRLARASSNVRGAKARLAQVMREMETKIEAGEQITLEERAQYKWDAARMGRDCEEAVISLYKSTGARGLLLSNPMQRHLRDVLAGANHITQNADDIAGNAGGVLLGADNTDLLI